MSDSNCLCGGSGVIFDLGPQGEPCPECVGGKYSARGQASFKAQQIKMRSGCTVVALIVTTAAVAVAEALNWALTS
jgi:hypothetical protein